MIGVGGQAIDHDQADIARRIIGLTLPRAAGDGEVMARLKSVQAGIVEYDKLQLFTRRLKTDPNDPAARLTVGKSIITKKGDWPVGLQHLSKGGDARLRELTARDTAHPAKAELQFELAGQWWAQGKQDEPFRADCEARAVYWYKLAEPGLADLKQVLARKRIAETAPLRRLPESVTHVAPVSLPPGNGVPAATGVKIAAAKPVALNEMFDKCLHGDATAFDRLQITFDHTKLKPKTTLEAQRVTGMLSLNAAGSPYAVTGFLLIEKEATLVIEPGTIVLFAPDIKVQNQGTLRVVSDGAWSVRAGADPATRWKGIDSTRKVELHRCLVMGADFAFGMHECRDSLSANECIFAGNGETVGAGNGGRAVVKNSLFLRNELGPFGHGDNGKVEFSQCLLLFNRRGCSANFYGRTDGSSSTFFGNQTAIEAADVGDGVRISLCNIISANGVPLGTRGGKAIVSGNYWGSKGPPTDAKHDTSSALSAPVKDSLPALGICEYLKGVEVSAASPAPPANPNAAGAVPFLTFADAVGTWKEKSGGDMVLSKNGRLLYAGRQPGTWTLTADTLVLTWDKGRVDTYNTREGDTISGQSTIGHKVSITKSSR